MDINETIFHTCDTVEPLLSENNKREKGGKRKRERERHTQKKFSKPKYPKNLVNGFILFALIAF